MKQIKRTLTYLTLILLVLFAVSPYYALHKIKTAYETKDYDYIVEQIDYSQLSSNLKAQLNQSLQETISNYSILNTLGGKTLKKVGKELVSKSVNKTVTPENILSILNTKNEISQSTKELGAVWALATDKIDLISLAKHTILTGGDFKNALKLQLQAEIEKMDTQKNNSNQHNSDVKLRYCAMNCFQVNTHLHSFPVSIKLHRVNFFQWKVVQIELP